MISELKILLRFKNEFLHEDVGHSTMSVIGDTIAPGILPDGGYMMIDSQYLEGQGVYGNGYDTSVSSDFTLGFWLYPINAGVVTDPSSGDVEVIEMALLDFNSIGSGNSSIIKITEGTTVDGNNKLKISLPDGSYYAVTEEYTTSLWHHFWVVKSGAYLQVYIDGKETTLTESGSVPATISGSLLDLYINHSLDGYAHNVSKNYGYISDISLMNVANTSEVDIQKVINNGIEYLVDSSFSNIDYHKFSIYFNDPDTITVTSAVDDMMYVYIGRNDGKIMRGSPLMWDTRIIFAQDGEKDFLKLPYDSDGTHSGWSITDGCLDISNTNIRL